MNATLVMAFVMGLTGSLHCAGMCGAIVWVMPFKVFTGFRRVLAISLYHLGRISVYAGMAAVLHSFRSLFDPQVQQVVSVGLGVVLLIAGAISFFPGVLKTAGRVPWSGYVTRQLGSFIGHPGLGKILVAGMLNGMLPCGLVYMALSASMSATTLPSVVGFMYVFGLGTLPLLLSITLLKGRINLRIPAARKLVPVVTFFFGCLFILRGLNLGVPYISPKIVVTGGKMIHSCCHK